ncbi:M20 aminoacylase family protein [Pararhodospirillum photometricum]|uniref:Peptidase M20D, amidohydrolase, putative n=1 Tax=Pararhodospirillum photometricum DSM 122 TaxID=1150469 RepID=H6SRG4_PARPM|nr:M20 aminoacylase family protein [Pararhodospirillum photometricum]CCG07493.1 Peptidase M20D, amidohydrolase, putative [Pararhodospirillum photometricum DSM 122]
MTAPPPSYLERVAPFIDPMTAWRRALHALPELSYAESQTADLVAQTLAEQGLSVHRGLAGTGVVGTLHGRHLGERAIGLRADMDALPIQEINDLPHASRHPGVMHACGHDGHTAMLLGAACALAHSRDFAGTVHFIFQPAEEGRGGARKMIDDGLFRLFPVEAVYGLHNWPELPAGVFAVHPGPVMAACDAFTISIRGCGGHAAMPHQTVDPVLIAGHVLTAAQSLISRSTNPFESAVVSVTRLEAGTAFNVIPDEARLWGTIRSFDPTTRRMLHDKLDRLVAHIAAAFGAEAQLVIEPRASATINHRSEAERAAQAAALVVGADKVVRDLQPAMTAEDFGDLLNVVPGAYLWLGQGNDRAPCYLHQPDYDFNDAVLGVGAAFWLALVESLLAP